MFLYWFLASIDIALTLYFYLCKISNKKRVISKHKTKLTDKNNNPIAIVELKSSDKKFSIEIL